MPARFIVNQVFGFWEVLLLGQTPFQLLTLLGVRGFAFPAVFPIPAVSLLVRQTRHKVFQAPLKVQGRAKRLLLSLITAGQLLLARIPAAVAAGVCRKILLANYGL